MEKIFGSYETLFAVNAQLPEEEVKATVEKFKALIAENGTIDAVNEWGKRKLTYPINDVTEGYYTLITFKAPAEFPAELERLYGISDAVLRSIVVRADETKKAPAVPAEAETEAEAE